LPTNNRRWLCASALTSAKARLSTPLTTTLTGVEDNGRMA